MPSMAAIRGSWRLTVCGVYDSVFVSSDAIVLFRLVNVGSLHPEASHNAEAGSDLSFTKLDYERQKRNM